MRRQGADLAAEVDLMAGLAAWDEIGGKCDQKTTSQFKGGSRWQVKGTDQLPDGLQCLSRMQCAVQPLFYC